MSTVECSTGEELYEFAEKCILRRKTYYTTALNEPKNIIGEAIGDKDLIRQILEIEYLDIDDENTYNNISRFSRLWNNVNTHVSTLAKLRSIGKGVIANKDFFIKTFEHVKNSHEFTSVTFFSLSSMRINNIRAVIQEEDPTTRTSFSVDLGLFDIDIAFNYNNICAVDTTPTSMIAAAYAKPKGSNKPVNIDGRTCYHPHVRGDHLLCLGTYREQMSIDASRLDFLSIIQTTCRLINRYNANSLMFAGAYINNWIGEKCHCCNGFAGDSVVRCAATNSPMHISCAVEIEGRYYKPEVIKTCTSCGCLCLPENYTAITPRIGVCSNCEIPE
jgi:hypothetical protein